jgi:hypothetical protein
MPRNLEAEVRGLQLYAVAATLVAGALFVTGYHLPGHRARFGEIDVERLNLVEKDGRLDLVMANRDRVPDPIVDGKPMKGARKDHNPGMFFYNDEGDENGGLGFAGGKTKDGHQADAALMFDQYKQDQTVGLVYNDDNGQRQAGLQIWDRPEQSLSVLGDRVAAAQAMKPGPARDQAMAKLEADYRRGDYGVTRLFVGKQPDRSSGVVLSDPQGRQRLSLAVDAKGEPRLQFRDAAGKVTYELTGQGAGKGR